GNRPRMESYLSRWASVRVSVMSLTPLHSMSAPASCAALKTFLPIRPKPLIPAVVLIRWCPVLSLGYSEPEPAARGPAYQRNWGPQALYGAESALRRGIGPTGGGAACPRRGGSPRPCTRRAPSTRAR